MDLNRFIYAQDAKYNIILKELKNGKKETHWIWYIFPQFIGLGVSEISEYFAIKSLDEAREYLNNEVLGKRLRECCNILLGLEDKDIIEIFGEIDTMKVRSSMTLFDYIVPNDIFGKVLDKYYMGERDNLTLEMFKSLKLNR